MSTSIERLAKHDFLTEAETRTHLKRLLKLKWTSLLTAFACFASAPWLANKGGYTSIGGFTVNETQLIFCGFASMAWFLHSGLAGDQYNAAGIKQLELSKTMLDEDQSIRETVTRWLSLRPLQVRDAKFLAALQPHWKHERHVAEFNRSLHANPGSSHLPPEEK